MSETPGERICREMAEKYTAEDKYGSGSIELRLWDDRYREFFRELREKIDAAVLGAGR